MEIRAGAASPWKAYLASPLDYVSPLDLLCLRRLEQRPCFTVLGDLAQSIYAHRGLTSWDEAAAVFAERYPEAVRRLDAQRLPIAAIELQQPSLDDAFLTLTGREYRA